MTNTGMRGGDFESRIAQYLQKQNGYRDAATIAEAIGTSTRETRQVCNRLHWNPWIPVKGDPKKQTRRGSFTRFKYEKIDKD